MVMGLRDAATSLSPIFQASVTIPFLHFPFKEFLGEVVVWLFGNFA